MDPWVGTRNRLGAVSMCFSTALDLHDGASRQISHPVRICAMEPRDGTVIYDPKAALEPSTISLLGPQHDHLPPDLDQCPVSQQVGYAKTEYRCDDNGESLHRVAVLGISRPVQRRPPGCGRHRAYHGTPPRGTLTPTAERLKDAVRPGSLGGLSGATLSGIRGSKRLPARFQMGHFFARGAAAENGVSVRKTSKLTDDFAMPSCVRGELDEHRPQVGRSPRDQLLEELH